MPPRVGGTVGWCEEFLERLEASLRLLHHLVGRCQAVAMLDLGGLDIHMRSCITAIGFSNSVIESSLSHLARLQTSTDLSWAQRMVFRGGADRVRVQRTQEHHPHLLPLRAAQGPPDTSLQLLRPDSAQDPCRDPGATCEATGTDAMVDGGGPWHP